MENENGVKITITANCVDGESETTAEGNPISVIATLTAALVDYIKKFSCDTSNVNEDTVKKVRANLALQSIKNIAKLMLEEDKQ